MIHYRSRRWIYILGLGLFGLYLLEVINLIVFPILLPDNWPHNLSWDGTLQTLGAINWIPLAHQPALSSFTAASRLRFTLSDIFLNILLTIPFGFGISFFVPLRKKYIALVALGAGFTLEGIELVMKLVFGASFHAVDITDVLTNALGVLVGYGLYQITSWVIRSVRVRHKS
jgi:glycopeptide antibiotics resistance protein